MSGVLAPATIDEAARALTDLAVRQSAIAIVGGGTELDLGNPPARVGATISTEHLNEVVEYAPEDQVVTVEAGMTLARLQELLHPHRQRLALDPPGARWASIGGIVATNAYGPRRGLFGAMRDLVLGMTVVRADGVVARGGGKVVKNVAGFDLPKLMVGSLGTLALIATVTLRVHPRPETERALAFDGRTLDEIRMLLRDAIEEQLEPGSALALLEPAGYTLCIRFEGFGPGVDAQVVALREIARRRAFHAEELSPSEWAPLDERHEDVRMRGGLRVKITAQSSDLGRLHDRAIAPLAAVLSGARVAVYPVAGAAFVSGEPSDDAVLSSALASARAAVEERGGTLVIAAAPPGVRARVEAWGTPPSSFPLMLALKDRFDPQHRLNPGRFVGGL
jgi:glycolate oxidase FAD binding subunit